MGKRMAARGVRRVRVDPELEDVKVLAVTIEQAGRMLSLARGTVYRLVQRQELASFSVGRARRVPVSSIEAFIAARSVGGRAA